MSKQEKRQYAEICKVASIEEDERTVTAVISSDAIDRDREVLMPKGVNTDNYEKNPVVLWSHDAASPPIGKALWIKKGTKKITAKLKFAMTERAEEVWQLFKTGFLKAFSVGFVPTKGHIPEPDEIKKNPDWAEARYIIDEWELLEFSPVTVPANPEALALAVKSGDIELSKSMLDELDVEEMIEISDETKEPEEIKDEPVAVQVPVKVLSQKIKATPRPVDTTPIVDVESVMLREAGKMFCRGISK